MVSRPRPKVPPITDLVEATEAAIIEGYRLGVLTELDRAAVQALRDLAVKISVQDEYFDALRHEQQDGRPPGIDNVSIPTFLKFCQALGLTVSARTAEAVKPPAEKAVAKSGVAKFRQATGAASRV